MRRSRSWLSNAAKNLEANLDILSWHNYGPHASDTATDAQRMAWTPPNYRDDVIKVKNGGLNGVLTGPSGKKFGAATARRSGTAAPRTSMASACTPMRATAGRFRRILVSYDRPASTGDYRGYIDDIVITNGALP